MTHSSSHQSPDAYLKFPSPPSSRGYIHLECFGGTTANGWVLHALCNPDRPVSATLCAVCKKDCRLKDVKWADTGEVIAEYRARLRKIIPRGTRVRLRLLSWLSILVGMVAGVAASYPFWSRRSVFPPFAGFLAGLLIGFVVAFSFFRLPKIDYRIYR